MKQTKQLTKELSTLSIQDMRELRDQLQETINSKVRKERGW